MSSRRSREATNTVNEPKKDEEELALEKLVFGDSEGFELSLRDLDLENFLNEKNEDDLSDPEATDDEKEEEDDAEDVAGLDDAQLFFVDDDVKMSDASHDEASTTDSSDEDDDDILDVNGGRAAWIDSDDERLEISLVDSNRLKKLRKNGGEDIVTGKEYVKRLRTRFEKIYPVPLWAQDKVADIASEDEDEDMESDDDAPISSDPLAKLLQSTSRYISNDKTKLLPAGVIDIDRLKDANQAARSIGAVQSLQFHPTHPLLLTSGYDKTLRLFHIDGKTNPLVTTLHISRSPLHTALFHPDGIRVFAGGKRKHLHIWNIETGTVVKFTNLGGNDQFHRDTRKFKISPCGRFLALMGSEGWVSILSCNNGQWITSVKVEGSVADLAWFSEGKGLAVLNTAGDVWEWDSAKRQFTGRWRDEGGVGSSTIALGGKDNRWCAIGSGAGIVNVYDRQSLQGGIVSSEGEPLSYKPRATLKQLVTAITTLEFSPDGQMLVMASKEKKDAFKLVHVPSFTVFKNWPTTVTPFGRVTSFDFTPGGEYMSVGNLQGKARLWKFAHYSA
ncbi:hypothetical protein DV113_001814 [Geotrichum candidum]|uniref:Similar to Saccharomyces cerevisiae YJL069C UTP18 Possible U3 snoRNP protein involved in maturation of pre-18S rRNA n=1 Tax=Geotrichum candidum TaxID=1173061 RepID=A0A0J9X3U9_GEOCN|nr:hypothetical protein DV452_001731 [Geotrichum candidum]KAF7500182.1 hypothetical protein DV113_001814 [Geotrichum candidum]KAI8135390.1 hypothetical protein DUD61_001003 [Geotrichum candidum]KAI9212434.1 hypothetical protein DS838_002711 [Geotrichum bryndzae]CDO51798.1 similar to Saccharomyces cerevisiae YJL069C UTP18 Possible U3 snoRNP protein involved in maturation of pre-18S rRNA [Geotrichum candidum]